jgi:pimeloyl-ACP methyl ester carboxylesterase
MCFQCLCTITGNFHLTPQFLTMLMYFDDSGIGDSTYSSAQGADEITIESLARDLAFLVAHLRWSEVAICGFSMGGPTLRRSIFNPSFTYPLLGVVVQQMLVLPYQQPHPTPLPFRVTHVFLAATRSVVLRDPQHGLQIRPANVPRTPAERTAIIRRTLQATFDPEWLHANSGRFEQILHATVHGRYAARLSISIVRD